MARFYRAVPRHHLLPILLLPLNSVSSDFLDNTAFQAGFAFKLFFLLCVVVAGAYGGYSVSRRIFFVQSVPALLALLFLLLG